ncbi:MAG TPA: cupredoxin domain-containing protein [Candidatus Krumholzibacteria bacterium]|nr:cupredoxin domain-containing protein [Candidatus Krumholzibacteria bacterium]
MKRLLLPGIMGLLIACTSGLDRPVDSVDAKVDADGVQRVKVDMHSYYFEPNRIVVKAGTPVDLELHNCSHIVPHNLTISGPDLNASDSKWGWGTGHVRFTPTKAGEYRFFCHKDGHEKKGMVGTLVVVD